MHAIMEANLVHYQSNEDISKLFKKIFELIDGESREKLMVSLVNSMTHDTNPVAFACLEHMLDTQLIEAKRSKKSNMDFLVYLPLFILPVVQSITKQHVIFADNQSSIMKILAKLIQLLPLHVDSLKSNFSKNL